jgi:hypothetical protein
MKGYAQNDSRERFSIRMGFTPGGISVNYFSFGWIFVWTYFSKKKIWVVQMWCKSPKTKSQAVKK